MHELEKQATLCQRQTLWGEFNKCRTDVLLQGNPVFYFFLELCEDWNKSLCLLNYLGQNWMPRACNGGEACHTGLQLGSSQTAQELCRLEWREIAWLLYIFRIANNYQKLWENSFSPTTFPTLIIEERGIYVVKCTETVWGKWEGEDSWVGIFVPSPAGFYSTVDEIVTWWRGLWVSFEGSGRKAMVSFSVCLISGRWNASWKVLSKSSPKRFAAWVNVVSSNFGFLPLDFSPQHCKLLDVSLLKTTGLSSIPHFVPVTNHFPSSYVKQQSW